MLPTTSRRGDGSLLGSTSSLGLLHPRRSSFRCVGSLSRRVVLGGAAGTRDCKCSLSGRPHAEQVHPVRPGLQASCRALQLQLRANSDAADGPDPLACSSSRNVQALTTIHLAFQTIATRILRKYTTMVDKAKELEATGAWPTRRNIRKVAEEN